MKTFRILLAVAMTSAILVANGARAEDIDLYTGSSAGGDPNVVFVLDNQSNWAATMDKAPPAGAIALCGAGDAGSYYCAQKYALVTLLEKTDASGNYVVGESVGIGLMMYGAGTNKGGYMRFGVRKMTSANRAALVKVLKSLTIADKGSSNQDYGYMMWEGFKYFGGGNGSPWSSTTWGPIPTNGVGIGTDARDYSGNTNAGSAHAAYTALSLAPQGPYAYTSSSTNNSGANPPVKYVPPTNPTGCGKNYIIYIGHSDSQPNNNNTDAQALFIGVGGSTVRVSPSRASSGDEGARYLFNSDVDPVTTGTQNVITYTVGTYDAPCTGQVCGMIATMKSMARVGGGSYYDATSIDQLYKAFLDILTEIQAINSVFVSAALPLSVNTQGLFLNQVFIGMFRPDGDGSPKWLGNLKQYQLKYDAATNSIRLADADNVDAIDGSGFVSALARSFWTSASTPDMWTNWVPTRTLTASDTPDGPEVQKGGAAQRLRETNRTTQANRNVYTCPLDAAGNPACGSSGSSLTGASYQFKKSGSAPAFATYAAAKLVPAFNLPIAADSDIDDLIAWIRGTDNVSPSPEQGPGGTTTVRPTVHGDVVHSRPVAVNYSGRVVVYYGANDGMLRAVEGKQTGLVAGEEIWSFVAPELLSKLNRLRQESPKVFLPSSATPSPNNKDYFLDGPIGVWQEGTPTSTSKAVIYVGARRGGNFIYAFDVTNPDDPKFKFKLDSTTLSRLGQTWSAPKVMRVRDSTGLGKVVLIFGAGYDIAQDSNSPGTAGRAVYVVDADTGTLIKEFHTAVDGSTISTSVPAEITIVDSDRDGFVDRAYVGDLDGNVWRMDVDDVVSNAASGWKLHKLASLGSGLKFFYPPDIVLQAGHTAVMLGSGDREKPLLDTSTDIFFMIKDAEIDKDGTGQTTIAKSDLLALPAAGGTPLADADLAAAKGWYYTLRTGEKTVNGPLTIGGVVYFGTNRPVSGLACKNDLGEARSYAFNFNSGLGARPPGGVGTGDDAYSLVLTGGGLPPTAVAGLLDFGPGVGVKPFCIGCGDRRSALEGGLPNIDPTPVRRKIHWKIKNDK